MGGEARGKSTETVLHSLARKIDFSMQEKQYAPAVIWFDHICDIQETIESRDAGETMMIRC